MIKAELLIEFESNQPEKLVSTVMDQIRDQIQEISTDIKRIRVTVSVLPEKVRDYRKGEALQYTGWAEK
jgi:uncharacterized protein YnzC (UPF0291/DUF896 family)